MRARFLTPAQAAAERYWSSVAPVWNFSASWRVLPTQDVPIVLSIDGVTTGRMMRWGLIPYSGQSSYPLINATVEKLTTWYGWRYPWEHGRRCVLPMSGFYEPHVFAGGRKDPFYVHLRDRPIFGVAGIWECKRGEDGTEALSCALITVPANELMAEVHNEKLRMPAMLREEDEAAWLTGRPEEAMQALQPYPSDAMEAWQVSRRLYANKVPDGEGLIERIQGSDARGLICLTRTRGASRSVRVTWHSVSFCRAIFKFEDARFDVAQKCANLVSSALALVEQGAEQTLEIRAHRHRDGRRRVAMESHDQFV